jgi:hypothetical protein
LVLLIDAVAHRIEKIAIRPVGELLEMETVALGAAENVVAIGIGRARKSQKRACERDEACRSHGLMSPSRRDSAGYRRAARLAQAAAYFICASFISLRA